MQFLKDEKEREHHFRLIAMNDALEEHYKIKLFDLKLEWGEEDEDIE